MAYCGNCGNPLAEGKKFCGSCGAAVEAPAAPAQQTRQQGYQQPTAGTAPIAETQRNGAKGFETPKNKVMHPTNYTQEMDSADIRKNRLMGGLAYLLFFLPLMICPESKYGRFHANQGLVYMLSCTAAWIATYVYAITVYSIGFLPHLLTDIWFVLLWIGILGYAVMGVFNGLAGKAREMPFIGKIRIIK